MVVEARHFPAPHLTLANPLAVGPRTLPGKWKVTGEIVNWEVDSDSGGTERIFLAVTRAPIAALEELVARLPSAQPKGAPSYTSLDPEQQGGVLRGIGATAPASRKGLAPAADAIEDALRSAASEQGLVTLEFELKSDSR